MADLPPNVQEFNAIAGLVFAQLYRAFPILVDIDRPEIARGMGAVGTEWRQHKLPSGRTLGDMMAYTFAWLAREDFTIPSGSHPAERVTLSAKGLAAMNAVPFGMQQPLGTELIRAAEHDPGGNSAGYIGELIGSMIGGFTKSVASGG